MSETHKILTGRLVDMIIMQHQHYNYLLKQANSHGNMLTLMVNRTKYNSRKYFFSNIIVIVWNSLHNQVIAAASLNQFKARLDITQILN